MQILYFLESIRTPFLNTVFSAVTHLGEETLAIAIALFLYWCVSKKWGCYSLLVTFFSLYLNQFAKILCRVSRPWVAHPGFTIVESARAEATGYSFPSGHTANITGTLGSWARFTKKKWLRIIFLVLIAVVSFSRMYLGVHYPSDVLFSLVVGTILIFLLYRIYEKGEGISVRLRVSFLLAMAISFLFVLFVQLHAWPADIEIDNLNSAQKNSWLMAGLSAGMIVGIYFDKNVIDFRVKAPWWAQILKTVLGLGLVVAVKSGLKLIMPDALWWTAPRYFLTAVFATCVWPLTFPWFARGLRRKAPEAA